jgi:pimeloyl-ACP methyl ester carboxylesterase
VAGLVLSGCTLNIQGTVAVPFRVGARVLQGCDERWLTWIHEKLCRRMFPPSVAEPIIEAGFYFDAVPAALQALVGKDFLPVLQAFPGPVLFLNGQRDLIFRWNEAAFVATAPNARLQVIRWGSHRCSLERPQAFTDAVRHFAQSIGW